MVAFQGARHMTKVIAGFRCSETSAKSITTMTDPGATGVTATLLRSRRAGAGDPAPGRQRAIFSPSG